MFGGPELAVHAVHRARRCRVGDGGPHVDYGGIDLLVRFDFADGTQDDTIDLTNLGLNPADYDVVA